jgi:hypothetical protein
MPVYGAWLVGALALVAGADGVVADELGDGLAAP